MKERRGRRGRTEREMRQRQRREEREMTQKKRTAKRGRVPPRILSSGSVVVLDMLHY